jgi:hypothetical protein
VVIDTGPKETQRKKPLFGVDGEVRSKKDLTGAALLEMSDNPVTGEVKVYFISPVIRLIGTLPPRRGRRISEAMMSKGLCGFDVIFLA